MKKLISLIIVLTMLLAFPTAFADDLGVQIIGGDMAEAEPMSLEDIQLGKTYTIDGYAKLTPVEFKFIDCFAQFNKDADYKAANDSYKNKGHVYYQEKALNGDWAYFYINAGWNDSGLNADFVWLQIDVTNLQKTSVDFMNNASVKVIYGDDYEFAGWVRQGNMDYSTQVYRYGWDGTWGTFCVLDPANAEPIDMMYTGTYVFGCTLPNSVVEDIKTPLQMIVNIGENEMIYNIRK